MGSGPLHIAVTGTDTGVGKSHVMRQLTLGLRALGRRVWIHKPVACGEWDGEQAEDGRLLLPLVGDGQDPATCAPRQWPEACSPHLAAALAGDQVSTADLVASCAQLQGDQDLLVEGAGGVLVPLATDGGTLLDLAAQLQLPLLVVTRPHLGTLNHTALTVRAIQAAGLDCLGLVLNFHAAVSPSYAVRSARDELAAITGLPVLAELPFADSDPLQAPRLAEAVLAAHAGRSG